MYPMTKRIDEKTLMRVRGTAFLFNKDDDVTDFSTICNDVHHFVKSCYSHDRTWLKSSSILLNGAIKIYRNEADNLLNDAAQIAIFGHETHSENTEMESADEDSEDESHKISDENNTSSTNSSKDGITSHEGDEDLIRSDESVGSHCIENKTIRKRSKLVDYDDSENPTEVFNKSGEVDKTHKKKVTSVERYDTDYVNTQKRRKLVDYEESETFTEVVDNSSKDDVSDYQKDGTYLNKDHRSVGRYETDNATIQKRIELVDYEGSDTFTEVIDNSGEDYENYKHRDTNNKDSINKQMPRKLVCYEESETFTEIVDSSSDSEISTILMKFY